MRARLARVPLILKRFRQAVLAAACSGTLTAGWRETCPNLDPAGNRWRLKEPAANETALAEVPDLWVRRPLKHISERVSVGHVGPTTKHYCAADVGVPFVRSQNVRPERLDLEGIQHITPEFHGALKKSQLKAGDLLIVRVGANRGDTCIVPAGLGELNCANIVLARPLAGVSRWLEMYCQSPEGKAQLDEMTTGSAQGVLNTTSIAELLIPLPPLAEQHEIVRRVDALLSLADAIERRVALATARADKVPQAILNKAFRGELVPTEAELARAEGRTYEPASDMLARIRKEREATAAAPSRAKAPRRKAAG
jgi:type I restriction enzyme S subunit